MRHDFTSASVTSTLKALAIALAWIPLAHAATQTNQCRDGKAADGIERTGSGPQCMVTQKFEPAGANARVLLVFLYGDNGGSLEVLTGRETALNLSQQLKITTIAFQRPISRSDPGLSGGATSAEVDDYTPGNVALVAAALDQLRPLNPGKKILLIGYSGGAAVAALLASRFPASADAYLLAGCPCDVPPWRQWRNASARENGHWTHSLSPQDEVGNINAGTHMRLVVGNKDDNTLPKFSETYAARLQAQGVKTRLTYAIGATHVSVQRAPEFVMLAQELASDLSR